MTRRGRPPHDDALTPAEWRVVEGVRHGMTSRQIAERRGISVDAVKFHVGNALAKLGLKNRRELRMWDGAARNSALASGERMAMGEFGAIGQVSRHVADIAAAQDWYGRVLGLKLLYSFGDLAFFDMGGVRLYLQQRAGQKTGQKTSEPAPESILYFRVADIRAGYDSLAARGVAFLGAPHMIHRHGDGSEEWMAFFNDNEGRPLALMALHRPSGETS